MSPSRMLLVEDDPLTQDLLTGVLETHGWQVDVASDGFSSLQLMRERAYQVALVDYHLPEMDGYALARLMRDHTAGREPMQLIAITADHDGLAARRGFDHLFDAVLAKPFQPADLLASLTAALSPAQGRPVLVEEAKHLLAMPGVDRARLLARAMWHAHGLGHVPKARVVPPPDADQTAALRICFDLVDDETADLVVVLDARGLQDLLRSRLAGTARTPTVVLEPAFASVADAQFAVADPASWARVADLIGGGRRAS